MDAIFQLMILYFFNEVMEDYGFYLKITSLYHDLKKQNLFYHIVHKVIIYNFCFHFPCHLWKIIGSLNCVPKLES